MEQSRSKPVDDQAIAQRVFIWQSIPSLLGHWRLKEGRKSMASMKWNLTKTGQFNFKGKFSNRHLEIVHVSGKPIIWRNDLPDAVIYDILVEQFAGEWNDLSCKSPWARLEHGHGDNFSPSRLIIGDSKVIEIFTSSIEDDNRQFSVVSGDDNRIIGKTYRSRLMPIDYEPGGFELLNTIQGDPEPIIIAMVTFAFAEMVKTVYDNPFNC